MKMRNPADNALLRRVAGKAMSGCDGTGRFEATSAIEADAMARLARDELVLATPDGTALSELGRAALDREGSPDAPNRWLVRRGNAGREPLIENLAESPLAWLMRRRMITPRQFEAGERLRGDYMLASRPPSVTMRWDAMPTAKGAKGPAERMDPTTAQISAKRRLAAATEDAGPGLGAILARVVCLGEGLEVAERAIGWPARAGKVVLGLALDRLAAHYRI